MTGRLYVLFQGFLVYAIESWILKPHLTPVLAQAPTASRNNIYSLSAFSLSPQAA